MALKYSYEYRVEPCGSGKTKHRTEGGRTLNPRCGIGKLVSWCFEPSQELGSRDVNQDVYDSRTP